MCIFNGKLAITWKWWETRPQLLLNTYRKSHIEWHKNLWLLLILKVINEQELYRLQLVFPSDSWAFFCSFWCDATYLCYSTSHTIISHWCFPIDVNYYHCICHIIAWIFLCVINSFVSLLDIVCILLSIFVYFCTVGSVKWIISILWVNEVVLS